MRPLSVGYVFERIPQNITVLISQTSNIIVYYEEALWFVWLAANINFESIHVSTYVLLNFYV